MTSPHDHDDDELSPDDELLVEAFSEQLSGLAYDADGEEYLLTTKDGVTVGVTAEQAEEYTQAVYETALAQVVAARPKETSPTTKFLQGFLGAALTVTFAAALLRLVFLMFGV